MGNIRLALAQINPTVGDLRANSELIIANSERAAALGADIVAFPELALTGYHPRDLLSSTVFLSACMQELQRISEAVHDITALVGVPLFESSTTNSAAICSEGRLAGSVSKTHMPGQGAMEEARYFDCGTGISLIRIKDTLVGVSLREDLWYLDGPAHKQSNAGASLLINMSAWPFIDGRSMFPEQLIAGVAERCKTPVAFVNMAGACDELIFEGGSLVMGADGKLIARAKPFVEDLLVVDVPVEHMGPVVEKGPLDDDELMIIEVRSTASAGETPLQALPKLEERENPEPMSPEHALYSALATGVLDFVEKGGFKGVLFVMDGGIASALTAAIAADALGSSAVSAFITLGRLTETARQCAAILGIKTIEVDPSVSGARSLGAGLMETADAEGLLPLSVITKSDLATGGITLYGETAGLLAPLKDLWASDIIRLARWRNSMGEAIPEGLIQPDAGKSTESAKTYEDAALKEIMENDMGFDEAMQAGGLGPAGLLDLIERMQSAEALRRQCPPGLRVTAKAIGLEWTLPLSGKFRPSG